MENERLKQLEQYLEQGSEDPFIRYAIATEYVKMDEKKTALEHFEMLQDLHPDYLGTYYHLGKLYESLGDREGAIKTYKKGIEVAAKLKNLHTLAEIRNALQNLLMDDYD